MQTADTIPGPSDVTRLWEVVSDRLEAFARVWETAGPPPNLAGFLPPGPPTRWLVLVELIKLDLDYRIQRNLDRALESYLRDFPELAADGPPSDLLYEDYHLRRRAGWSADPADYYRRFPNRAADLARLLGGTTPAQSTSVFGGRVPLTVVPGDQIDDFDLLALLGEGQFAKVFLARQRAMQRLVALKISSQRGKEAQTLAQLDHPHIVRVYDQRVVPDRGFQLVYMPYLAGGTLLDLLDHVRLVSPDHRSGRTLLAAVDAALERRGEIPPAASTARQMWAARSWPATVCGIGAKLAAALDYAHRHGVLHRDVKPANVLLTTEGEPLLADFNVGSCSKLEGAGPAAFFGGSLAYMSPEHLEAFNPDHPRPPESLDGRTDIFGLAVTLWELTTLARPFGPEAFNGQWPQTLAALAARRRAGPPVAAASFPEGDVPGFREVILRCLDPDPDQRPATAGEMARELELCLRPATRSLVRPTSGGWRRVARRFPLATIYLIALIPNILASLFNIVYNQTEIIEKWPGAQKIILHEPIEQSVFNLIILAVNGVFFPLGLWLVARAVRPVARGLRQIQEGTRPNPDDLACLRLRSLRLGGITAWVSVGCWAVAGAVWPVALRAAAGPPPEGPVAYAHFLMSLVVCGLIAAAYPYFLVTFLAVRVFYPTLLGPNGLVSTDPPALRRVERELGFYRAVAAAVPLLAVTLLALSRTSIVPAMAVLSAAGLAGVGLAYLLEGRTRTDLAALAQVPTRDWG